ncbi:MsnO8 family LLM class oxidoreductase [Hyphomonas johnsonii]|uniref:Bacterial luciferase-like protein n=1 Tax=Hyphomonas johnsonii MHS-2 TaxID=1280950 RepID=A0A059F955_9PROT|nr:MsnO8 family LLM class oxidoreductase [Hyphomonas johnsonii]KCZ87135.1 bacterial luciferase-like protein [Hyphomonas johnsonii MHS-2]
MKPVLSVLDPSPLFEGWDAADAFAQTVALAEALDGSDWRAFWVQEHHNAASFAGTAPEVLMAALAQRTQHLKIGSGGVMLPNYSPLKVAEQFCALSALTPGRIELGLGRATGSDPRTAAALLGPGADSFPGMLRLLMDWMLDATGEVPLPADHRARGIRVGPLGHRPDVWMLSSSTESAAFAGAMGLKLAYADFLAPGGGPAAIAAYRASFQPSIFAAIPHAALGLVGLAADTEADAHRLSRSSVAWNITRAAGAFEPFPRMDTAAEQLATASPEAITAASSHGMVGEADRVAGQLVSTAQAAAADEVFLLTITESLDARIRSYELIARAMARL